ncbi:3-hydroxyacyl-CoA dehydrogenase NAD-binding domain-containing protein [Kytococcus sedentarius]|uniref:3-hydroxyacyl-CoA dehydrogenase NAD-binding domain-containing protein n=1 Tax=Kytococcus sedentarius TaxID=1276 RepID=UPI0019528BB1|nr:3-hydroxyacyl-CoA dehydrogenase NAD-binding domain-containing protein [Kytococcus sedentarius]QRO87228.1 NAD-binding protein [Kytococcus sedentarius]
MSARRAAVIGAGTIGLGWAGVFAGHGWEVAVFDPREDLEAALDRAAQDAAEALGAAGGSSGSEVTAEAVRGRLTAAASLEEAVEGAAHVQESGPEDLEWKRGTFAQLEAATGPETVLATSSSFITASEISRDNLEQGRTLVGHPFNPVLVLPLVEVVGGPGTSSSTVEAAVETYRSVGKHPVVVGAEVQGFIGNRLQFVLLAEALHLVEQGVATPEEIDEVVRTSLGPRWASLGPLRASSMGGARGMTGLFELLAPELEKLEPGMPDLATQIRTTGVVDAAYGDNQPTPAEVARRLRGALSDD